MKVVRACAEEGLQRPVRAVFVETGEDMERAGEAHLPHLASRRRPAGLRWVLQDAVPVSCGEDSRSQDMMVAFLVGPGAPAGSLRLTGPYACGVHPLHLQSQHDSRRYISPEIR